MKVLSLSCRRESEQDARIAGYLTKEEKNNKVSLHKEKAEGASYIETEYRVLKSTDKASLLKSVLSQERAIRSGDIWYLSDIQYLVITNMEIVILTTRSSGKMV